MTIKQSPRRTAGLIAAAALLGISTTAVASPKFDYAKVVSSNPVIRYVTVKTPVRECWDETEYYTVDTRRSGRAGGTILGAVIGGVVGHQIGSGRGNDAATVVGSLLGAAIGNDVSERRYIASGGPVQQSRVVERCETHIREHREERIDGYQVVYMYHGQKYATTMPHDPGKKLRIRVDVRPAV
jgi:uncharacterized protein YcfJ